MKATSYSESLAHWRKELADAHKADGLEPPSEDYVLSQLIYGEITAFVMAQDPVAILEIAVSRGRIVLTWREDPLDKLADGWVDKGGVR